MRDRRMGVGLCRAIERKGKGGLRARESRSRGLGEREQKGVG